LEEENQKLKQLLAGVSMDADDPAGLSQCASRAAGG
jgi:hypothetical protein